jgi:hypothetical protein
MMGVQGVLYEKKSRQADSPGGFFSVTGLTAT